MRKAALYGLSSVAAAFALAPAGCTVFSGWGDLQGGRLDAGASDGSPPPSDAANEDASSGCTEPCRDAGNATPGACTSARDCAGGLCCVVDFISFRGACAASCTGGLIACTPDDPGGCPPPFSACRSQGRVSVCE